MIIKVMDKQDVKEWATIYDMASELWERIESAPKCLEEGESLDELMEAIEKVSKVKQALSAVEAEGLYSAYIPTGTL